MPKNKKEMIDRFLSRIRQGGLTVRYWDGDKKEYGPDASRVLINFHQPLPLDWRLADPLLAFGEAYMDGIFDIDGSWPDLTRTLRRNPDLFYGKKPQNGLTRSIRKGVADLALKLQQKENIHHHYDLGNDFFALWLDQTMSYSCAYFKRPDDTLDQAQIQKIDHILKKLQLKPGERLLDIGCGWGWLVLRAAEQYPVEAVGITLSEAQCQAARERAGGRKLAGKVEIRLLDYLDLQPAEGRYDKIVSVGMFEHVGKRNLPRYMNQIHKLLKPGGLSMLHTIAGIREGSQNNWSERYIFPGGYVPSLREVVNLLPDYDFHLLHAESLRLHYARTLDSWYANFDRQRDRVRAMFDERFVRMWQLYLLTSAAQFRSTGLDIYQLLFSSGLNNQLPLTLEHIYSP